MKNLTFFLLAIFCIFLSCSGENETFDIANEKRPHNPWIFRTVLDETPRMITLALHQNLWAAYNTQTASLYKVWKGRVNFDGAVYTTYHGPQPTTIGDAFFENNFEEPWELRGPKGQYLETTIDYKGHRIVDEKAQLMYHIVSGDYRVSVTETVEAIQDSEKNLIFQRDYDVTMPSVLKLYMNTNVNSIVVKENVETDGELEVLKEETKLFNKREILSFEGKLKLNRGNTKFHIKLIDTPVVENPKKAIYEEEDKEDLPKGAILIAKSDCKSCHNKNVKTIGPSYRAIAKKYADTDDNLEILTAKVKRGGGGVWGSQLMTAHPEYTEEDIRQMVSYILSIDEPDDLQALAQTEVGQMIKSKEVNIGELIPGALTRVFEVPKGTVKIPSFDKLKILQAGIMPSFDNIADNDFGDLVENFAIDARGYIEIPEDGLYKFRVWSDDGSRVTLSDKLILDHDGPHGVSHKETELYLQKGFHPFYLEFYQGEGGKFLSFNWKPSKADRWMVVPPEAYSHLSSDHALIGDLSLPMSNSSKIPGDQARRCTSQF